MDHSAPTWRRDGSGHLVLGERENALTAWGRALEANPADPELLRGKIDREVAAAGRLVDDSPSRGRVPDHDSAATDAPPPR